MFSMPCRTKDGLLPVATQVGDVLHAMQGLRLRSKLFDKWNAENNRNKNAQVNF